MRATQCHSLDSVVLISLVLVFSTLACSTFAAHAPPTATNHPPTVTSTITITAEPSPTKTPKPTITPAATETPICDIDEVIAGLKNDFPYDEFAIIYNDIDGMRLVVWFVDPGLDPFAVSDEIVDNAMLAMADAIILSIDLKKRDVCVSQLFTAINPIVVDRYYNGWFSGEISPDDIPDNYEYPQDIFDKILREDRIGYIRDRDVSRVSYQKAPAGSCSWPEARDNARRHFSPDVENIDFYLVIDDYGVNIWAQWISPMTPLDGEFASPLNVAMEMKCLHPKPDQLWIFVADESGVIDFIGLIPGSVLSSGDYEGVVNEMKVLFP
jgi:hypothetical protein